ncbi:MAG: diacylglycerol kinase family lipid kinase [Bacteroidetes bacterium]|nr:diacylglycerol kinase family lipid kinase [Fibrella sp.]
MTFLFAINPASGGKDKSDWETTIQTFFAHSPHTAELLRLTGDDDESLVQRRIDALKPDRVIAVGGDGTVKLVAERVLGTPTPMGILPAGSANGMAHELAIPFAPEGALRVVVDGVTKPIDAICIGESDMCLHLSDIGMNAQLIKYYQQNNWRGKLGYARGVLRVMARRRLLQVSINTGDVTLHRAAFMVVLANARVYGTGAVINPDGDLSDGIFEVVVLRRLSIWEILKMFWRYQPFDPSKVEIIPATSVFIETRKKAYFQVDGEYRGRVTEVRAQIRPGQIQMLVPAGR